MALLIIPTNDMILITFYCFRIPQNISYTQIDTNACKIYENTKTKQCDVVLTFKGLILMCLCVCNTNIVQF